MTTSPKKPFLKKNLIRFLVIIICVFAGNIIKKNMNSKKVRATENPLEWKHFTSKENGFSVSFPADPIISPVKEQKTGSISYVSQTFQSADSYSNIYEIEVSDLKIAPEKFDTDRGIKGIIDNLISHLKESGVFNPEIISNKNCTSLDYPCKDVYLKGNYKNETYYQYIRILANNKLKNNVKLFLISYSGSTANDNKNEAFVKSFQTI